MVCWGKNGTDKRKKKLKQVLISIRLQQSLYERLERKSAELGFVGISEVIRMLLGIGLESPMADFSDPEEKRPKEINSRVQKKELQHIVAIYYLLREHILNPDEKAAKVNNIAHDKAENAFKEILEG